MAKLLLSFVLLGIGPLLPAQDEGAVTPCEPGAVTVDGTTYPYRLLRPRADERGNATPLVVFLHGAGERGTDNERQLTWFVNDMARPEAMRRWPCHVLAVQCPKGERWVDVDWSEQRTSTWPQEPSRAMGAVLAAMDQVLARENIDRGRVYLTGLSMGGYGSWDLAMRYPERFAALLAVCGGGYEGRAGALLGLPIQVWHGDADRAVPVERSRTMVAALQGLGAEVTYHELPGVGHDSWRQAYGERGSLDWLFAQDQRRQRRGDWATYAVVPSPDRVRIDPGRYALGESSRIVVADGCAVAGRLLASGWFGFRDRQLDVVESEDVRPGDISIELAAGLGVAVEVEIGAVLRVRARDSMALPCAAAVALQALLTWPDGACPRGRFVIATVPSRGEVRVTLELTKWAPTHVIWLARLSWLYGAGAIVGPGFGQLAAGTDDPLLAIALAAVRDAGIELADDFERRDGEVLLARFGVDHEQTEILSQACPAGAIWCVEGDTVDPESLLLWLGVTMPRLAARVASPKVAPSPARLRAALGAHFRGR